MHGLRYAAGCRGCLHLRSQSRYIGTRTAISHAQCRQRKPAAAPGDQQLPGVQGVINEMRADPILSRILDSPRVQKAIQEIKDDPQAIAKYANDVQVMQVIQRVTTLGFKDSKGLQALLHQLGTSASDLATSMFSDGELAAKLTQPRIRAAIAEITRNPEAGMQKYENDAEVMGVLDALQARLEAQGQVIDV